MFDIINVNLFEHRPLTRMYFHTLKMAYRKTEMSVNIDNKLH